MPNINLPTTLNLNSGAVKINKSRYSVNVFVVVSNTATLARLCQSWRVEEQNLLRTHQGAETRLQQKL
ncbi:MAG: hypothetical protein O6826_05195 [Acidobacteria bacterium]|nr:hypothetical protein [Acidobacteriota bacterium]